MPAEQRPPRTTLVVIEQKPHLGIRLWLGLAVGVWIVIGALTYVGSPRPTPQRAMQTIRMVLTIGAGQTLFIRDPGTARPTKAPGLPCGVRCVHRDEELRHEHEPSDERKRAEPEARRHFGRFSQTTLMIAQRPFHFTSSRKSTQPPASMRTTAAFPKTLRIVTSSRR